MWVNVCLHIKMLESTCACMSFDMFTCEWVRVCVCMRACVHACVCMCVMCIVCMWMSMNVHLCTQMFVCVCISKSYLCFLYFFIWTVSINVCIRVCLFKTYMCAGEWTCVCARARFLWDGIYRFVSVIIFIYLCENVYQYVCVSDWC